MLLEMDPNASVVWQAVIGGLVAICIAFIRAQSRRIKQIHKLAESTHILVNSNMGLQLKINAIATRRLAIMTGEKDDSEAANLAERLYLEHQTKQEVVDAKVPFSEVPFKPK